jgi:hypothetical protein
MSLASKAQNFGQRFETALRGMGPTGWAVTIVVMAVAVIFAPLSAALVVLWLRLSRTPLRDVGLVRPDNWANMLALGIATGIALKFLMKAVVMPYLGAPATNPFLAPLEGNLVAALNASARMMVLGGLLEEIVFRGFLFNRLQTAFGIGFVARAVMVVGAGTFFGAVHYLGQGVFGAVHAAILGIAIGAVYFLNRQRLGYLIVVHAAFNATGVWMTYAGLEEAVARSVFG